MDSFFILHILSPQTNSVDTDEMPHYAAFHLGLHCVSKNINTKGLNKETKGTDMHSVNVILI